MFFTLFYCTYDALDRKKMADLRVGWKHVSKKGGRVVDSDWPRVGQWQSILAAPAPLVLLVVSSGRGGAARTALDQLHQQQRWAARTALLTTWSPRSSRSPPPSLLDHRQRPASRFCCWCCFADLDYQRLDQLQYEHSQDVYFPF